VVWRRWRRRQGGPDRVLAQCGHSSRLVLLGCVVGVMGMAVMRRRPSVVLLLYRMAMVINAMSGCMVRLMGMMLWMVVAVMSVVVVSVMMS